MIYMKGCILNSAKMQILAHKLEIELEDTPKLQEKSDSKIMLP